MIKINSITETGNHIQANYEYYFNVVLIGGLKLLIE